MDAQGVRNPTIYYWTDSRSEYSRWVGLFSEYSGWVGLFSEYSGWGSLVNIVGGWGSLVNTVGGALNEYVCIILLIFTVGVGLIQHC